ncbi:DUF7551 domain-containing protein [Haloarcula litorea]|uniref:DUF7551 domain-containing protein n=1 Tax=Haloarcula litorea TaxID=3032579 RepID=UPI0023E809B4|nr:hypothetical protein [Halomicroarcula sp. GDY20]
MIGTTLGDIRDHIESLATRDGEYYLVCGRSGDRPVPAAGLRFDSRATARAAARATEQYRATLRRYDPRLPYYDVVVCQADDAAPGRAGPRREPSAAAAEPERRDRVEFCHRVAAAVFEALSTRGHDAVESAVLDAYFDLAERLSDPDDLCLCLLEATAAELDAALAPGEQAAVVSTAASHLSAPADDALPVDATLSHLRTNGVLGAYERRGGTGGWTGESRTVTVALSDYALSPRDGRLPVLPLAVDLSRRPFALAFEAVTVADRSDGWRLSLSFARDPTPRGLVSAPIRTAVT